MKKEILLVTLFTLGLAASASAEELRGDCADSAKALVGIAGGIAVGELAALDTIAGVEITNVTSKTHPHYVAYTATVRGYGMSALVSMEATNASCHVAQASIAADASVP